MNHISIDIETLDTVPGGVILSIGAREFDPVAGAIGEAFHEIINLDSCLRYNLSWSSETREWWWKQSPEARVTFDKATHDEGRPLPEILAAFAMWVYARCPDAAKQVHVWGYGPAFDNAFLAVAYARVGLKLPWAFRNDRCLRTLKGLFPRGTVELPARFGTHHNALDDATYQAQCIVAYLQALQDVSRRAGPPMERAALDGRRAEREATGRISYPSATETAAIKQSSQVASEWPACPQCQLPLIPTTTGLVCENGHVGG